MKQEQKKKQPFVYVVDQELRMVYFNEEPAGDFPEVEYGRHCYEVICREESQCPECPLRKENHGKSIIYDQLHGVWIRVSNTRIDWPGVGSCSMIITDGSADSGLFNEQYFFQNTEQFLQKKTDGTQWCMVSIDIENLKLFNEWYGRKAGDKLLAGISDCLSNLQAEREMIVGYCGNDDFVVVMEYQEWQVEQIYREILALMDEYGNKTGFLPAFGVYEIKDKNEPAVTMYDRAELARAAVKGNYNMRIKKFEPQMLEKLETQYTLYKDVKRALQEKEFTFYLQPKCNMENGRIMGAEALARWESKDKGMISPGVFIPFLESTGFIVELDAYIWEEVCKWQRSRIDAGNPTVPVSVNVSKADIYSMDVPAYFQKLIQTYQLSTGLIEIEITESTYTEDNDFINQVVNELRSRGFQVLMDDFGSGYSSLNMLKDIEVDVLKLDMRFLSINENNASKGISILETVYNMARILDIDVIVEGVETEEQKAFLLKIGCGYGQGYYFYRPLPVAEFETVIQDGENLDKKSHW